MLNHQPCRFGTIRSVNVVKHAKSIIANGENKMNDNTRETETGEKLADDKINVETEIMEEVTDGNSGQTAVMNFPSNSHELVAGNSYNDEKSAGNLLDNELCQQGEFEGDINNEDVNHGSLDDESYPSGGLDSNGAAGAWLDTEMAVEDLTSEIVDKTVSREAPNPIHTSKEESNYHSDRNTDNIESDAMNVDKISVVEENANLEVVNRKLPEVHMKVEDPPFKSESITSFQEIPALLNTPKEEPDSQNDKVADNIKSKFIYVDKKLVPKEDLQQELGDGKLPKAVDGSAGSTRMQFDAIEKDENREQNNLKKIFEPGCVFVQYRRTEASCTAAHSIHGRLFDNRIVTVEYIDPNLYRVKFPK